MRPREFRTDNWPAGLILNDTTGIITSSIAEREDFNEILHAKSTYGSYFRIFKISWGDVLALTPTMVNTRRRTQNNLQVGVLTF